MATEYDLYHHPELNQEIQRKVSKSLHNLSRLCLKVCYKDKPPTDKCLNNCLSSYVEAFDLVLETLDPNLKT